MNGTIKHPLNIPGVRGHILAGRNNVRFKLPLKINITSVREHIPISIKDKLVYANLIKEVTE
jgi:hypothetical protein